MTTTNTQVSSAATNIPTTTETAVLVFTIPPLNNPAGQGVEINASVSFTAGTGTTSAQVRVRQGNGVAGAVVGAIAQAPTTAGIENSLDALVLDPTLSYPTGNTYTVTVQQVGASGNGTMIYASAVTNPATAQVG